MRARNIKPGFFKNELLVELPFEYRLLFIGLWTLADREGRLEDRPTKIKMALFPADSVDVEAGLQALHDHRFILRYEVGGKPFIAISAWGKHQNPHYKEVPSAIPAPGSSPVHEPNASGSPRVSPRQALGEPEASPGSKPLARAPNPADSLIPDSLIPDPPLPPDGGTPPARRGTRAGEAGKLWPTGWSEEAEKELQSLLAEYPKKRPDGTRMSNGSPKELRRLWLGILQANPQVTPRLLKLCAYEHLESEHSPGVRVEETGFVQLLSTVFGPKKASWESYLEGAMARQRAQDSGLNPEPIPLMRLQEVAHG